MTTDTTTTLDDLRATQSAPVLTPDDPGYAGAAQKWGAPAAADVIVTPADATEVGAALTWAAEAGMDVAVRSGGHGMWAPMPGGLLIDLGAFTAVDVDDQIVRIGAGTTWGDVADALAPHGLALSSGDARSVGVGGNTLGAGVGWLVRSVGLATDQLVGAELVAVDGRVVHVSATENAELFFALRGGGGNFGVVTRFDFRATALTDIVFGTAPLEVSQLATVIRGVRDVMRDAPRQLAMRLLVMVMPGMTDGPPPMLQAAWAGDDEDAARAATAPLSAVDGVGEFDLHAVPYGATLNDPEMPPGPPPRMTGTSGIFVAIPDETADRAAAALAQHPTSMFEIRFLGGAVADVPVDETALAWRDAEALVHWIPMVAPDATDDDLAQAAAVWAPVGEGSAAVLGTFTEGTGPDLVARMYPPATLERLRAVKEVWDPGNLLHRNHNIAPR